MSAKTDPRPPEIIPALLNPPLVPAHELADGEIIPPPQHYQWAPLLYQITLSPEDEGFGGG